MSTSHFGQRVKATQQHLLEQLVVKFLGNEATLSARRKAVGVCQHRLRFHSFPDTNPDTVLSHFHNVCEILQMESREREFRKLKKLKDQFLSTPWDSDVLDFQSTVLRFLLCLTGNLTSSTTAVDMEIEPVLDETPLPAESVSEESDLALSDWSEESEIQSPASEEDQTESTGLVITRSIHWSDYFQSTGKDPMANTGPVLEEQDNSNGLLLYSLASVQFGGTPLINVCPLLIKTEVELVANCLRVLQGESGSVFIWDATERCFNIDPNLQTRHFSAVAMRRVLSCFGRTGSQTRDLLDWSSHIIDASSRQELAAVCSYRTIIIPSQYQNLCPTLSACAHAVHEQIECLLGPIVDAEQQLKAARSDSENTLIWLQRVSGLLMKKIELLHRLQNRLQSFQKESSRMSSVLSCKVLDEVYSWLIEEHLTGSIPSSGLYMIWKIFSETLRPLLSQLTAWLYLGDISSVSKGFLLSVEEPKRDENLNLWTESYPLRPNSCPEFLTEVLSVLHDGGKALQMLRNQEYKNPFGELGLVENSTKNGRIETLINGKWTKDLLHQKFTEFLSNQFSPLVNNETKPVLESLNEDDISFFKQMAESSRPWVKNTPTLNLMDSEEDFLAINKRHEIDDISLQSANVDEAEEIDEDSSLPEDYRQILSAMESMKRELNLAMNISSSSHSVLSKVLPKPVSRESYCQLHDKIFSSSSKLKAKEMNSSLYWSFDCLLPPPVVIKQGLLDLIQSRSLEIMKSFISCLLTDLGLMKEIIVLKNVFLIGSPAVNEWTRHFTEKLIDGNLISDLGEYQVILDMQECFALCSIGEKLPVCGDDEFEHLFFDMRVMEWDKRFQNQEIWLERSPQELEDCGLVYPLDWPLSLLVNEVKLRKYNTIFLFLLKLQWASYAIKDVSMMAKKRRCSIKTEQLMNFKNLRNWRNMYKVIHDMNHFLTSLKHYVSENIHQSFNNFQKNLTNMESVSEMQKQHDKMLDSIQCFSFQSRKKQWKTVHSRLLTLLHAILNFSSLWKKLYSTVISNSPPLNPLNAVKDLTKVSEVLRWTNEVIEEYNDARSSTMMILHIYSYSLGDNRELNDLITMLNFNQIHVHYDPSLM